LVLEKISDCGGVRAGDICYIEMKIINNTGMVLAGLLNLDATQGEELFDGEGIITQFLPDVTTDGWLDSSEWLLGTVFFTDFNIAPGETFVSVKINTHPALSPDEYLFLLSLFGTGDDGEEYVAPPVIGGGGGGILGGGSVFGDINGDGRVDKYDFALMMAFWGQEVSGLRVDLNGDGKVDKYDFALLMLNWSI